MPPGVGAAETIWVGAAPSIDLTPVPKSDPGSTLKAGWQHGAFMEIFVRGYKDSDGDGIGDLRGLIQQLDYLKDLGVTGLWLMPVSPSSDHDHGYATTDFRGIEPAYGTLADFDELLRQAHARGMGVITDYVINHSSATHPMFVSAAASKTSPFRNWYVWEKTAPGGWDIWGQNPWTTTTNGAFFATFGPHMPDFNFRNPAVRAYHADSLRFWLNRGLDGFRLDAVPHLVENSAEHWNDQPQSRALTHELMRLISGYDQRHVVCEATAKPEAYASANVCGSAFAFGHQYNIVKAAKGDSKAVQAVAGYFKKAPMSLATMVSNHDMFSGARLWDQVGGQVAQYKLAAATYLLQPGTPFIYYGEEIGMAGTPGLAGDAPLRGPMSWSADAANAGFTSGTPYRPVSANVATHNAAAQLADPDSIHAFYKNMLALRNALPALARGSYRHVSVHGDVMGFERRLGKERVLVLINFGAGAARVPVKSLGVKSHWARQYPSSHSALQADARGSADANIPAQSVAVWSLQK